MAAASKALATLISDNAHYLFTKTFNLAFPQTASRPLHSVRRALARRMVLAAAIPQVQKAIDDMGSERANQKEDDLKHREWGKRSHGEHTRCGTINDPHTPAQQTKREATYYTTSVQSTNVRRVRGSGFIRLD